MRKHIYNLFLLFPVLFICSCDMGHSRLLSINDGIFYEFQYKSGGMKLSISMAERNLGLPGRMIVSTNGRTIMSEKINHDASSDSLFIVYPDSMAMEFDGNKVLFADLFTLDNTISTDKILFFNYKKSKSNPKGQRKKLSVLPCNFIKHQGKAVINDTISWNIIY